MRTTILLALTLSIFLTACGSSDENADLVGSWEFDNGSLQMTATIQNQEIIIDWVDQNFSALYWKGTFVEIGSNDLDILSEGDTEAMDASLMGSGDPTKNFHYDKGQISFDLTVLGVTQTIYLEKVE